MNNVAQLQRLARYVLRPAQWDEYAERWSRTLPVDVPGDFSARLAADVRAGVSQVCHAERDGVRVGFVVYTVTRTHELVVQAAFGRDGSNLMAEFLPRLEVLARACECATLRFHTMRPGLVAKAQGHGFRVSEIIMRKDVS